jgi:hypothetical protein
LTDLLPISDIRRGLQIVVLKSFFDAGNKDESAQYEVLSLAVISGTGSDWKPFEREWKKTLKKHKAAYLHTTDAVARQGIYKGWSVRQRDAFLADLVRISGHHAARATFGDAIGRYGIFCFIVSVVLKDFIACAKVNPIASKNANEACLRQAIGEVLTWSEDQAACNECHCIFDQGEPFYGFLVHLLQTKKALQRAPLLRKITFRGEADSRRTPALQYADFYAWCQSHRNSKRKPKWQTKMLNTHFRWQWMDKTNLHDINTAHQTEFLTWNLPRRRPTR